MHQDDSSMCLSGPAELTQKLRVKAASNPDLARLAWDRAEAEHRLPPLQQWWGQEAAGPDLLDDVTCTDRQAKDLLPVSSTQTHNGRLQDQLYHTRIPVLYWWSFCHWLCWSSTIPLDRFQWRRCWCAGPKILRRGLMTRRENVPINVNYYTCLHTRTLPFTLPGTTSHPIILRLSQGSGICWGPPSISKEAKRWKALSSLNRFAAKKWWTLKVKER